MSFPRSPDSELSIVWLYEATRKMAAERNFQAAAVGGGKLQRTIASFWNGSAATGSLDDSLVGRTGSCEASMDEVCLL